MDTANINTASAEAENPSAQEGSAPAADSYASGGTLPAQEERQGTDWKKEARKWESRAKENAEAARRLAEIEDAAKNEAEKTAERLAKAEAERDEAQALAKRLEVAASAGVPAEFLAGPGDDIEAFAASLKEWAGGKALAAASGAPRDSFGEMPSHSGVGTLDEQIEAAARDGNKALAARLKAQKLGA